jgi:bifunctional non-homologous end joining protein LigD
VCQTRFPDAACYHDAMRAREAARALATLPAARLTPAELPFMLPTLAATPPRGESWLFELKWDGVRVLMLRVGARVQLWSRNAVEVSAQYPEVAAALAALAGGDLALDAEVVALDDEGRPSFQRLQRRMHVVRGRAQAIGAAPVTACVYDCLALDGRDTRELPLVARKALLRELLPAGGSLRYSDHVEGEGAEFFAVARDAGLEGIVAKRADSPYRGGRRREWLKIKCHRRQEFVIGGYTAPKGTRAHLGSLHVGVYEGEALVYAGRVGSGLDTRGLEDLHERLRALAVARSPFARGAPPRDRENHWVRPVLVCEVRFTEWTEDDRIRHPVFLGLRADKSPTDVVREPTPRS